MSELTDFRDHCQERLAWQPGPPRAACKTTTTFGSPKPADHANCGGHRCGCSCHQPTDHERVLFAHLADEIDRHLTPNDDAEGLF